MNPWGFLGRNLREQDPEDTLVGVKTYDSGPDISGPMSDRYGKALSKAVGGYANELGLGPYPIGINPRSANLGAINDQHAESGDISQVRGSWNPDTGTVEVAPGITADQNGETSAHELSHAADTIRGHRYDSTAASDNPNTHHKYFARATGEQAITMDSQQALEQGFPVNPAILARYPWLKDVKPMSSNKLATPWDFYRSPEDKRVDEIMSRK